MPKALPVTRGRKFLQVLEGARTIFLRDGFEGASVDDIAREAAVSKATLYSYFPDKRVMFMEVFRNELAREAAAPKEYGGRGGNDPARYGDWEVKGIACDF